MKDSKIAKQMRKIIISCVEDLSLDGSSALHISSTVRKVKDRQDAAELLAAAVKVHDYHSLPKDWFNSSEEAIDRICESW